MSSALSLSICPDSLRPLIRVVVEEVLAQVRADEAKLNGRLAYGESEAAALLGLQPHQLRDERLRGRVEASVGPGRRVLYTREQLLKYLVGRRGESSGLATR
jgi:hypothetical protein